MTRNAVYILPVIVIAQFLCTSLWFAGNAVIPDLAATFQLDKTALGHITSAVQFGFITGTLSYALMALADRFSPSTVFLISALFAAACNVGMVIEGQGIGSLLILRFLTGFFLAGIYPVGMKIASDHYKEGLGKALGFLVGALVLGTAFPYLLKNYTTSAPWKTVLFFTSGLAVTGGLLIRLCVPDGPYRRTGPGLHITGIFSSFQNKAFRAAAVGYFGHMWELYSFWAFVPVILATYILIHPGQNFNIPLCSFLIIAPGGLACIASGFISQRFGSPRTAFTALLLSASCCLLSPLAFSLPFPAFMAFLIFWGLVVITDSPVFSSLVAQNAIPASKGTAITMVTCIGFSITIISLELINVLTTQLNNRYLYLLLAIGPLAGLLYKANTRKTIGL